MLNRSVLVLLVACGVARAESSAIEAAVISAMRGETADAREMLRLGAYLRSAGRVTDGDAWINAALSFDPEVAARVMAFGDARGGACASVGPDLTVAALPQINLMTHAGAPQDGVSAYGVGVTVCNLGDAGIEWVDSTSRHPIAVTNVYRVHDGRFTQIGMSWAKHEFFALASNHCCTCSGFAPGQLSAGCSDSFSASVAASQNLLGPRSQVNAATGAFTYPPVAPPIGSSLDRRCQVADADLDPVLNAGARWFGEVQYITPDDAEAGNDDNNCGYREVAFAASGDGFGGAYIGAAVGGEPAIKAWAALDPSAVVVDVDVPDDGRFHVGSNVIDNGDGTWRYEYAVHNMNSDRSAQAFSVPVPDGVVLSEVGFHDVSYHSGEPYDGTDWSFSRSAGVATWTTESFDANPDANALRWGTAYSFWFTADAAPAEADAAITLFKPGTARGAMSAGVSAPGGAACAADLDASGAVDAGDLAVLLAAWGSAGAADLDGSGAVDAADLAILLAAWGAC